MTHSGRETRHQTCGCEDAARFNGHLVRAEWKALETVHARARADVHLISPRHEWDVIATSRFRLGQVDVILPPLGVPAFGVSYGEPLRLERTLHGRRTTGTVTPGTLAILPPDADTRWIFDKTGDIVLVYLSRQLFTQMIEHEAGRDARTAEIVPRFLIRDLILERIAHQLLKEVCEPYQGSRLSAETLAHELCHYLIQAHSNLNPLPVRRPYPMAPSKLRRAQEFIRANLGRDMSLREIADAAGMSLFHFARAFRQATGRPPHRYLVEQRLMHARALLHAASLPIGEIAKAVGFTHSHFTAIFVRHMGMTPSKFRDVLQF